MARFVSEFGAQSVPKDADFIDAAEWPDLDWEMLGERHCMQKVFFDRYTPPAAFEHFDAWAQATRDYQAMVVRFHIETLRRLKYRPTGGFTQFMFADSVPGITWSVLSADRVPKEAYQALAEACQPLLPIADRLPTHLHPQETRTIEVHVVNDLRHDVTEMLLTATLITPDGTNTHSWQGGVEADSVQRVGSIELTAPSTPGPVTLELELLSNEGLVTRSYRTEVADCGVPH
jgi:beta-mannosidase